MFDELIYVTRKSEFISREMGGLVLFLLFLNSWGKRKVDRIRAGLGEESEFLSELYASLFVGRNSRRPGHRLVQLDT